MAVDVCFAQGKKEDAAMSEPAELEVSLQGVQAEVANLQEEDKAMGTRMDEISVKLEAASADIEGLKKSAEEMVRLDTAQKAQQGEIAGLKAEIRAQNNKIESLIKKEQEARTLKADSLDNAIKQLDGKQSATADSLRDDLGSLQAAGGRTDEKISRLNVGLIAGGSVLLIAIIAFTIYLIIKRRRDSSSLAEVRKAQDALQAAQAKMREDSVKLDNQLLELLEKQMTASPAAAGSSAPDHSLTLKVADEVTRIEMNLSRMDATVKGYKQLSKAVQRIKDNFMANGYEIVDMLGKPYNEGMKVIANFVADESLEQGKQIITGIVKPQINYKGQVIQTAQITVSQNI